MRSLQVEVKWRKGKHFRLKEQPDYNARSKRHGLFEKTTISSA